MDARETLIKGIQLRLGAGMIDVELDPEHYDYAIQNAEDRYRQRSSNGVEESFVFLDIQPKVQTYTLPPEVQTVQSVYRRGIGGAGGGAAVDPFSLAFTNNLYMIQNPGGLGGSGSGTLATYDFAMQFQEQAARMFGRDVMYTWDPATSRITFQRIFHAVENVAIHVHNTRPLAVLLKDPYAKLWIRDYATAYCKLMLGEARSLYQNLGGPQGGVSLNGDAIKQEGKDEMDRLEDEIKNFVDSDIGMPFTIG
jgi:hypothetical protein